MTFQFSPVGAPFEHELRLFKLRREEFKWGHFWEMGTGKSWQLCHEIAWAWHHSEIDCAVIMAKKGEYSNWAHYLIPDLLPPDVPRQVVLYSSQLVGSTSQYHALRNLMKPDPGVLRILVVNVESLNSHTCQRLMKEFFASSERGIFYAVDESTCVKEPSSKRSVECYFWAHKSKMKRIMTGTPVTQSPLDLWGQTMVLGPKLLGFSSFYSFRNTFTIREPMYLGPKRSFMAVTGYRDLDKLNKILDSFSDQVYKKDCLDLPDKVYTKRSVDMTKNQAALYKQMREEAMVEIEGHEVEVTTILAQITKLHQIVCGQLKVSDTEYVSVENNRIDSLVELLETFNGKALIWANYRQSLADVTAALKKKFGDAAVVSYYGGTSNADREYAVRAFQDRGSDVRFFVGNPQSAGFGITLTAATLVVYYSNSYNLEHRLQSEDRAHRIGQTESVTYVDMVTPNTIDERILEVLRNKKNLAHEVLGSPISTWI